MYRFFFPEKKQGECDDFAKKIAEKGGNIIALSRA